MMLPIHCPSRGGSPLGRVRCAIERKHQSQRNRSVCVVICKYVYVYESLCVGLCRQNQYPKNKTADSRQQIAESGQQTAEIRDQRSEIRDQRADSRQQTSDSRWQMADKSTMTWKGWLLGSAGSMRAHNCRMSRTCRNLRVTV
jgi:hypothetical protein